MDIRTLENESLLQLYVGDELSDVDRAELEVQLKVDVALRSQLHDLRVLQDDVDQTLAKLDRFDSIKASEPGHRDLMRAIRQRMVERAARPQVTPATKKIMPWWGWVGSGVAAATVIFCIRILSTDSPLHSLPPIAPYVHDDGGDPTPTIAAGDGDADLPKGTSSSVALVDARSQQLSSLEDRVHEDLRDGWH